MRRIVITEQHGFYEIENLGGTLRAKSTSLERALRIAAVSVGIVEYGDELDLRSTPQVAHLLQELFGPELHREQIHDGPVTA